jgi:dCMP deaminase
MYLSILKKVIELTNTIELGKRDSWEEYFMSQAYIASLRSTCGSRRVGAIIVNSLNPGERKVLATGYNGNPPGDNHCFEGGCPRFKARLEGKIESGDYSDEFPCYAFHAEANALFQMSKLGISTKDCIVFTTTFPCRQCAEKMLGVGIKKIYYCEGYPDEFSAEYLKKYKIEVEKIQVRL